MRCALLAHWEEHFDTDKSAVEHGPLRDFGGATEEHQRRPSSGSRARGSTIVKALIQMSIGRLLGQVDIQVRY